MELARQQRHALGENIPEINDLNARESRLIPLLEQLNRGLNRTANNNPISLPMAVLAGDKPFRAMAYSMFTSPASKSRYAIALNTMMKNAGRGDFMRGGRNVAYGTGLVPETYDWYRETYPAAGASPRWGSLLDWINYFSGKN